MASAILPSHFVVLSDILKLAKENTGAILDLLPQTGDKQRKSEVRHTEKELQKAEKRKSELDNLFAKMYEGRAAGRLDEENYTMLSVRYRVEQQHINERVDLLRDKLQQSEQNQQSRIAQSGNPYIVSLSNIMRLD